MKARRNQAATAVYLLLYNNDGGVLLALRQNTGYQDGMWQVPAGHIDAGETPRQAMCREANEEIGIRLDPQHLSLVHTCFRAKCDDTGDRVDFFFAARLRKENGAIRNCEPHKCAKIQWFYPDGIYLPSNTTPHVHEAIMRTTGPLSRNTFAEYTLNDLRATGAYKITEPDETNEEFADRLIDETRSTPLQS